MITITLGFFSAVAEAITRAPRRLKMSFGYPGMVGRMSWKTGLEKRKGTLREECPLKIAQ